jgi:hypothetical protein
MLLKIFRLPEPVGLSDCSLGLCCVSGGLIAGDFIRFCRKNYQTSRQFIVLRDWKMQKISSGGLRYLKDIGPHTAFSYPACGFLSWLMVNIGHTDNF